MKNIEQKMNNCIDILQAEFENLQTEFNNDYTINYSVDYYDDSVIYVNCDLLFENSEITSEHKYIDVTKYNENEMIDFVNDFKYWVNETIEIDMNPNERYSD